MTPRKPLPHDKRGPAGSFWTGARTKQLIELVNAGMGDTAIARVLKTTRNTVLGKRNRLNMRANSADKKAKQVKRARAWKQQVSTGPKPPRPVTPRVILDEPAPVLGPDGKPYTISTVPRRCCQFIAGDDPMGPMCGHPAKNTTCEWHLTNRVRGAAAA